MVPGKAINIGLAWDCPRIEQFYRVFLIVESNRIRGAGHLLLVDS
jgi:hypothetical protein